MECWELSHVCASAGAQVNGDVDDVGGSVLRLLHQLSASLPAAEAIARATPPASGPLMSAMAAWGLAGLPALTKSHSCVTQHLTCGKDHPGK